MQDLLDLTNNYLYSLGNYYEPDLPDQLNVALDNLNYFRENCEPNAPCERPAMRGISGQASFSLYPNPTTGVARLEFWAENEGDVQLKIMDVRGVPSAQTLQAAKGLNTVEISLKNLPAGVYWVSLQGSTTMETLRLVKVGD